MGARRDAVVLVVDQFEELFRECDDEKQREKFLSLLGSLTDPTTAGGCAVVLGLRIDFYGQVAAYDQLVPSLQDAQILVGPLNREQLRESIVEPARSTGVSIDEDLASALLRDFVPSGSIGGLHDPGSLPLLAHALHETWSQRAERDHMTVEDYEAAGGIGGTIEAAAERVYEGLSPEDQTLAKEIFPASGAPRGRRRRDPPGGLVLRAGGPRRRRPRARRRCRRRDGRRRPPC